MNEMKPQNLMMLVIRKASVAGIQFPFHIYNCNDKWSFLTNIKS